MRWLSPKTSVRVAGTRRAAVDQARGRMMMIATMVALGYLLIGARAVDLSVLQGRSGDPAETAEILARVVKQDEKIIRADITDRNGVLLARSLKAVSLFADPSLIKAPDDVAKALSDIFPARSYGDILSSIQGTGRFSWVHRGLTPHQQEAVLNLGEPGLGFKNEWRRIYPQGELPSHLVGFTNIDGQGVSGIEAAFNDYLAKGRDPLALTLDIRLQHILRREVSNAVSRFKAKGAAGAIMDIQSGELLAGVSWPDFDPHNAGAASAEHRFNRLTLGVYELGSIFKIFSTAAWLETQGHRMDAAFDAREPLKRGKHLIRDYHPEKRILSLPEVFAHSSNIGTALMAEEVGSEDLRKVYSDLGLFDRSHLELLERGRPLIPQPWREIDTLTSSYGHGLAVAPLQALAAVASTAGDGLQVEPTLIYNTARSDEPAVRRRVFSDRTVEIMRGLLRLSVMHGTGKNADVPGYRVGGKTGTAQKVVNGRYAADKRISSFAGVFPADSPRYAVLIIVDEPQPRRDTYGYATGGWVAAPAVQAVIQAMAPVVGIVPEMPHSSPDPALHLSHFIQKDTP